MLLWFSHIGIAGHRRWTAGFSAQEQAFHSVSLQFFDHLGQDGSVHDGHVHQPHSHNGSAPQTPSASEQSAARCSMQRCQSLTFRHARQALSCPRAGRSVRQCQGLFVYICQTRPVYIAQTASSMLTHTVGRWQAAHRATHVSEMSGRAPAASQTLMNGVSVTH